MNSGKRQRRYSGKRVCGLPELLRKQELINSKNFTNEKYAELSKEFGGVFRFRLPSIPTAVEAPEVDVGKYYCTAKIIIFNLTCLNAVAYLDFKRFSPFSDLKLPTERSHVM